MGLKYRPEIDGLRAIAVSVVILYHAEFLIFGINPFEGGFVGVDVFFVISGFLISSIIMKEMKSNSFSFGNFYLRRARRILPALFTVMAISIPFAWLLLEPYAMKDYASSGLSALFFSSNIWFWLEDSYTAEISALKPFLHTWTLSVEEQFYIVFPIFLLLVWRFFRKHIAAILFVVSVASLTLAQVLSADWVDSTFYLAHTRMWELLAGSLLALPATQTMRNQNFRLNAYLPFLGLVMIFGSVVLFNDEMRHPSLITAIPVIGTMLLIQFCQAGETVTKSLSSATLVGLGLISYSLYLWHFPIFAFIRIAVDVPANYIMFFAIIASILLAALTYFGIEKPTRNKQRIKTKKFVRIMCASFLSLTMAFVFIVKTEGAFFRMGEYADSNRKKEKTKCHNTNIIVREILPCFASADSQNSSLLLIGDSHAEKLDIELRELAHDKNIRFYQFTKNVCLYFEGVSWTREKIDSCREFGDYPKALNRWMGSKKSDKKIDTIVWSGRLSLQLEGPFDNEEGGVEFWNKKVSRLQQMPGQGDKSVQEIIVENFEFWAAQAEQLVIIYPVPEVGWNVPKLYVRRLMRNKFGANYDMDITTSLNLYKERNARAYAILDSVKAENVIRIYPHKVFCSEKTERCRTVDENGFLYIDDDHLSPNGARKIVMLIKKKLDPSNSEVLNP